LSISSLNSLSSKKLDTKRVYELLEAELQHYQTYWKLNKKEADNILLSVTTMKNPGFKK